MSNKEKPKGKLTLQSLSRLLANAQNINATDSEVAGALNSIVVPILNQDFGGDQEAVKEALAQGTITATTFILFNKEVKIAEDVAKQNAPK